MVVNMSYAWRLGEREVAIIAFSGLLINNGLLLGGGGKKLPLVLAYRVNKMYIICIT